MPKTDQKAPLWSIQFAGNFTDGFCILRQMNKGISLIDDGVVIHADDETIPWRFDHLLKITERVGDGTNTLTLHYMRTVGSI